MPRYTLRKTFEATLTVDAEDMDDAYIIGDTTEDDEWEHADEPTVTCFETVTCDEDEE